MTGRIFDIQRFSIHDGPGIRTTVFLKGCPLHCKWCHNPEGISPDPQLSVVPENCIGCASCLGTCKTGALALNGKRTIVIDRPRCTACGDCAPACDPRALEMVGRTASVDEVIAVVLRDREYYLASGGGVTLSGGEPLLQPDFTHALLRAAKAAGVSTCIETSGFADGAVVEKVAPLTDFFLYDYKETDPQRHTAYTGVSNDLILENLHKLYARGARIALRCPIIPGCNDREDHFAGIAALSREMPGLAEIDLVPYHPLGRGKIARLGMADSPLAAADLPARATLDGWIGWFAKQGIQVRCR